MRYEENVRNLESLDMKKFSGQLLDFCVHIEFYWMCWLLDFLEKSLGKAYTRISYAAFGMFLGFTEVIVFWSVYDDTRENNHKKDNKRKRFSNHGRSIGINA